MAVKLALVFCFAVLVSGCRYSQNPGLMKNTFQDGDDDLVDLSDRTTDTDPAYAGENGVTDFTFVNPIDIHDSSNLNYYIKVCDNGVLILANSSGFAEPCKNISEIQALGTITGPVIIADAIAENLSATVNYTVEAHYILRSDQMHKNGDVVSGCGNEVTALNSKILISATLLENDADNQVVGPSYCELQIIEGMINDCEELGRKNITVEEAAVVTWRIQHSTNENYDFQAIVAVTTDASTYVIFLYESSPVIPGSGNGFARGEIHAANSELGGESRYSVICNAESDTELHMKSNCRCAEMGHFVFETTETTVAPHGFCGTETGKDTCTNQNNLLDDSMTLNRNCRNASVPQDSCDDSYYCELTPDRSMTFAFRNYDADRISFLDYAAYADADGDSGFANPHGDNIQPIDSSGVGSCSATITPSNTTFQTFTRSYSVSANPRCFTYNATENAFYFVYMLWRSSDGLFVMADGTRIVSGKCYLDDLKNYIHGTAVVDDIRSTTVPTRTGRGVALQLWDRRTTVDKQVIGSGSTVEIGDRLFAAICYTKGSPFVADTDPYGVYAYSFEIANNPAFDSTGDNETLMVIGSDGCLTSVPAVNSAGRFDDNFEAPSEVDASSEPFCILAGGFKAFRFPTGEPRLYMRCYVDLCTNTQLFSQSKCQDSCAFTTVDVNATDPGEGTVRKRRDVQNGEELQLVVEVVDPAPKSNQARRAECTDPVMAKSVIAALVTLLVIATFVTIAEFWVLQKKRK